MNSLTLEEVKEMKEQHDLAAVNYKENIMKELNDLETAIYRIKNGVIAYQPLFIEKMREIAAELGNKELEERMLMLRDSKSTIDCQIKYKYNSAETSEIFNNYYISIISELPELQIQNPNEDMTALMSRNFHTKGDPSIFVQNLCDSLNRKQEIYLYDMKMSEHKNKVSEEFYKWASKKGFEVNSKIVGIKYLPVENKFYLLNMYTISKKYLLEVNRIMYTQELGEKINIKKIESEIKESIENYIFENKKRESIEKEQTSFLLNIENQLKDLLKGFREVEIEDSDIFSTDPQITREPAILMGQIYLRINDNYYTNVSIENGTLSYFIKSVTDERQIIVFRENYHIKLVSVEEMIEELKLIIKKAQILIL